ncbi:hypothetical protein AVEN_89822-1 [Araneus ventricosus]|uniref:Uncharacterized protein n=1 Tax=Araneus ventricosus TaxID=182803 RepID=A0A4Y2JY08_ARAVE|nr:hypothetical protein AVEN_89822-1 [Araneus ventricosus]
MPPVPDAIAEPVEWTWNEAFTLKRTGEEVIMGPYLVRFEPMLIVIATRRSPDHVTASALGCAHTMINLTLLEPNWRFSAPSKFAKTRKGAKLCAHNRKAANLQCSQ